MPLTSLRSLALTVEERKVGEFSWVVLERFDVEDDFEVLVDAESPSRTYGDALAKGVAVLTALADNNLAIGPRAHLEDMPLFVETSRPGLYDLLDE